jgi:hypothetical protein
VSRGILTIVPRVPRSGAAMVQLRSLSVMLTRTPAQHHDYNLKLTKEELLCIANDSISDYCYTNKLLELIKKEAKKINGGS